MPRSPDEPVPPRVEASGKPPRIAEGPRPHPRAHAMPLQTQRELICPHCRTRDHHSVGGKAGWQYRRCNRCDGCEVCAIKPDGKGTPFKVRIDPPLAPKP